MNFNKKFENLIESDFFTKNPFFTIFFFIIFLEYLYGPFFYFHFLASQTNLSILSASTFWKMAEKHRKTLFSLKNKKFSLLRHGWDCFTRWKCNSWRFKWDHKLQWNQIISLRKKGLLCICLWLNTLYRPIHLM